MSNASPDQHFAIDANTDVKPSAALETLQQQCQVDCNIAPENCKQLVNLQNYLQLQSLSIKSLCISLLFCHSVLQSLLVCQRLLIII